MSLVVAVILYTWEIALTQVTSLLQTLAQLQPMFGLLAEGIILLGDFVIVFWILSVIFDRLESED